MTNPSPKWQRPGVRFQPGIRLGFQRGVNQLVNAIRPTLGPYPRHTLNQPMLLGKMPEFLDNGAVIARRIIMLPDRIEDTGAMYLREMLGNVYETAGDGTATAAVLFQSIYAQGLRYITAGGNAMSLRRHLEEASSLLLSELDRMTLALPGKAPLASFANSLCRDADLAEVLAEALDLLGVDGRLEIRAGRSRTMVLELFDGLYWDSGLLNRDPADLSGKVTLINPSILITDLDVQEPDELLPLLHLALDAGIQSLVLMVSRISEPAATLLRLPANRQRLQVAAVKTPIEPASVQENLEDLTWLIGGRPLLIAMGAKLETVKLENLGRARRAWADKEYLGIEAGLGDPRSLRQHLADLRSAMARANNTDDKRRLQKRISRLIYGSGVLWIGATTPLALEARKELAQRTVEAMRGALREGIVPGGGVALLNLKPLLQAEARQTKDTDALAAYRLLQTAVEAPFRALVSNAGYSPSEVLAQMAPRPSSQGFDVLHGEVKDMLPAGIVDAASVVKCALGSAIRSAALALTIDALVLRSNPPTGIKRQ